MWNTGMIAYSWVDIRTRLDSLKASGRTSRPSCQPSISYVHVVMAVSTLLQNCSAQWQIRNTISVWNDFIIALQIEPRCLCFCEVHCSNICERVLGYKKAFLFISVELDLTAFLVCSVATFSDKSTMGHLPTLKVNECALVLKVWISAFPYIWLHNDSLTLRLTTSYYCI